MDEQISYAFNGVFIPASLWLDKNLSWLEKCLIAEVDALAKPENPCFASAEHLAKHMDSTASSIRNMLSDLSKRGYLCQLGSNGHQVYRCVALKYTSNPGKYEEWAKDIRFKTAEHNLQMTQSNGVSPPGDSSVTHRLHSASLPGDTESTREVSREKKSSLIDSPKRKSKSDRTSVLMNMAELEKLEKNPAYQGIDVRAQAFKFNTWCEVNKKLKSVRRFVNWLNRVT